jgi:2,3-bisphosphoglycerate-dependent phosphoglycerate mutase
MKPIPPGGGLQTASQIHMKGLFLEKPGLLGEALKREELWKMQVPGYNATLSRNKSPMTSLERSLYKLRAERELGEWAGQFIDPNAPLEDDGNDGNMGRPIQLVEDKVWEEGLLELSSGGQFDPDGPVFHEANGGDAISFDEEEEKMKPFANLISSNQPCVKSMPSESMIPGVGAVPIRQDAVIVIIRHGKTEHNKLGLFTGWEDVPLAKVCRVLACHVHVNNFGQVLAFHVSQLTSINILLLLKDGVEEAREAGRLLKLHGFEFDVVYTSWLSRAIETAWHVIDELDSLWLPIVKTWRLNERMYGRLTGLSKKMVKQRHGEEQFKAWRRGYKTAPPKVSSFSQHYPGNDLRYQKYLKDLRFSARESVIRSIEKGKPTAHRKLPKAESLKDCMDRTVPFFTERIVPEAIDQGKRVLISSSENAIRGLLMHLCNIPEEQITGLEIPNGLP